MNLLEIIGQMSNLTGAIGGIISAIGIIKMLAVQRRQAGRVEVCLQGEDGQSVVLPLEMTRRDVSRAEILGRIGMLPMRQKGARFSLRALSTKEFLVGINMVVGGKTSMLIIPANKEEVEQFDFL